MSRQLSRREFSRRSGLAALTRSMCSLQAGDVWAGKSRRAAANVLPTYGDWRDVFAEKWTWDRVVRCTHTRVNCLSACAWDVYVKDGMAWREEQAQVYDEGRAGTPDFFPRG